MLESIVESVDESIVEGVDESEQTAQVKQTERTQHRRKASTRDGTAVESLFGIIERRIEDGEMLTDAETLPDATWAVETVGGLTAVFDLLTALDGDRETLRVIEKRAARLRERAETVDVPVDTLERLA